MSWATVKSVVTANFAPLFNTVKTSPVVTAVVNFEIEAASNDLLNTNLAVFEEVCSIDSTFNADVSFAIVTSPVNGVKMLPATSVAPAT